MDTLFLSSLFFLLSGAAEGEPPEAAQVPAGTMISVELVDGLHTGKNKSGDAFRARVCEGVWSRGVVAIPPGATVRGELVRVTPSGRLKGRSRLEVTLRSLEIDGRSYAVASDTLTYAGDPHAGKNLGSWLMGALQGAVYGVLFGGKEGAILGAGAGAAAGGVASVVTGKEDIEFKQGAKLLFETSAPMRLPIYSASNGMEPKQTLHGASKPAS